MMQARIRFGTNSTTTTIIKDWMDKIRNYHHCEPTGIRFVTKKPEVIEAELLFEDFKTEEDARELIRMGLNDWSVGFVMPKFFREFVERLPFDPKTKEYRYPKKYCEAELFGNLDVIRWIFTDEGLPRVEVDRKQFMWKDADKLIRLHEETIRDGFQTITLEQVERLNEAIEKFNEKYELEVPLI